MLVKKFEFVEFLFHECDLLVCDKTLTASLAEFTSPAKIMKEFAEHGEQGLVQKYFKSDKDEVHGMESKFALQVASIREDHAGSPKHIVLQDMLWGTWAKQFDEEFGELLENEQVGASFSWHKYLVDSQKDLGMKYKELVAACVAKPAATGAGPSAPAGVGASEMSEEKMLELQKTIDRVKTLRRQVVTFVPLPSAGGASGPEYTKAQLTKAWDFMKLGHKYTRKTGNIRAFVLDAALFPPNLSKHGRPGNFSDPVAADAERMRRTIEFIITKRTKDDVVCIFDGRSRACRKIIEEYETPLKAGDMHHVTEELYMYTQPIKTADPRVPCRTMVPFSSSMHEVALTAWPSKKNVVKVLHRKEFNSCGEQSTVANTYSGVPLRRMCELPRMDFDEKASILGNNAAGQSNGTRFQKDVEEKGHPFSFAEVKTHNLWQRCLEHHGVTHVIDFAPGSGALATAASGAAYYEGIAATDWHAKWLDRIVDRCVSYQVGKKDDANGKKFLEKVGADDEQLAAIEQYMSGFALDARRYLEPMDAEDAHEESEDDDDADGASGL